MTKTITVKDVKYLHDNYNISYGSAHGFLKVEIHPGYAGYMKVKQAARILLISPGTLYRRIRSGEVVAEKRYGVLNMSVANVLKLAQALNK